MAIIFSSILVSFLSGSLDSPLVPFRFRVSFWPAARVRLPRGPGMASSLCAAPAPSCLAAPAHLASAPPDFDTPLRLLAVRHSPVTGPPAPPCTCHCAKLSPLLLASFPRASLAPPVPARLVYMDGLNCKYTNFSSIFRGAANLQDLHCALSLFLTVRSLFEKS